MKVSGIIPARYASTRLPGKPLADICGRPMIWWVYNQTKKVGCLDSIFVATDDVRIEEICSQYGIPSIMTSSEHQTAATRLQEVSSIIQADFYIQINGDEPLINPEIIEKAIPEEIIANEAFGTNIISKISNITEAIDASNIKIVFDDKFYALYMSRTPIPYPFKSLDFDYYKHIGIIGYNKLMLDFYKSSEPGRLEIIEGIDTMRFIDYGKKLLLIPVDEFYSLSVDTQKDLGRIRSIIKNKLNKGELFYE